MTRFPIGMITLLVLSILVYFGVAQRVLDRLRLSDKAALGVIAAMIAGSYITVPLFTGNVNASLNLGGGLVPIALSIYLLAKAGTDKELWRTLIAVVVTGAALYLGGMILGAEPETMIIDPIYVYPLVGGIVAYGISRSRRGAFVAATLGVLSLDFIHLFRLLFAGTPGTVAIGGAGAFDSMVLAGIIGVLLAELIGETRERLQGGPATHGRPEELKEGLKNANYSDAFGLDIPEENEEDPLPQALTRRMKNQGGEDHEER